MDDLKPCPFCGGEVELEEAQPTRDLYGVRHWFGIVCRNTINLGGTCAIQIRPSASKEAAIKRWNTRAQLSAQSVSAVQPVADADAVDAKPNEGAGS